MGAVPTRCIRRRSSRYTWLPKHAPRPSLLHVLCLPWHGVSPSACGSCSSRRADDDHVPRSGLRRRRTRARTPIVSNMSAACPYLFFAKRPCVRHEGGAGGCSSTTPSASTLGAVSQHAPPHSASARRQVIFLFSFTVCSCCVFRCASQHGACRAASPSSTSMSCEDKGQCGVLRVAPRSSSRRHLTC